VDSGQTGDVVNDVHGKRALASGNDYLSICVATMDAVAAPLYVVNGEGRLLVTNRAAQSSLRQRCWLQSDAGRVSISLDLDSAPPLTSAWERLRRGNGSTVLLTHQHSGHQAVVTVSPISRTDGLEADVERLGLIWLTTSDPDLTAVRRVARIFNLTRAEQHVLAELVSGADLRQMAVRLGVSIHTVRNQLKAVLGKTGRHSQGQLLTLVTKMASLRSPEHD
jgi:DNA-binding CsgD family transcriptional regulator